MIHLSINNLTIQYDNHVVLNNFNAEFGPGLHWIKGHNGSGKSTLLKALCGINPVPPGTVKIMQHDLTTDAQNAKSKLCLVPDKPEIYPFMTGQQYLAFIAKIKGAQITKELEQWLETTKLSQFKDLEFSQMSFGTRRKFTISNVFIGNPAVILLDEPFNGLDKKSATVFQQWLADNKRKKCILVVNHEEHFIKNLADNSIDLGTEKTSYESFEP